MQEHLGRKTWSGLLAAGEKYLVFCELFRPTIIRLLKVNCGLEEPARSKALRGRRLSVLGRRGIATVIMWTGRELVAAKANSKLASSFVGKNG